MYLKVKLTPGAKKEILSKEGETFVISVKEPARQNLANRRLQEIMADFLGILPKEVRIVSGHTSRHKILSVPDN